MVKALLLSALTGLFLGIGAAAGWMLSMYLSSFWLLYKL